MGKIIAFEGADGAGKSTMLNIVEEKLQKEKLWTERFKFPVYESETGKKIKKMLHEDISRFQDVKFVKKYAHTQIEDKYNMITKLEKLRKNCDILLMDRFLISPFIYDIIFLQAIFDNKIANQLRTDVLLPAKIQTIMKFYDKTHRDMVSELMKTFDNNTMYVIMDKYHSHDFLSICSQRVANDSVDKDKKKQMFIEQCYGELFNPKYCDDFIYFKNRIQVGFDDLFAKHTSNYATDVKRIYLHLDAIFEDSKYMTARQYCDIVKTFNQTQNIIVDAVNNDASINIVSKIHEFI
jgi:hypothetical protein